MENAQCNRNIWLLNLFTIGINAVFALPIIVPYYHDQLGLTFQDFLIGESVFAAVMVLLDVPTGWIADQWGRKKTLTAGGFMFAIGFICLLEATGFWSAIISQGVIGIGTSLMSGANSALLYDSLLAAGREQEFRKREGFRFAVMFYSCAAACVIGGYLYTISPYLPMQMEIVVVIATTLLGFAFIEPPRHKKTVEGNPLADMWRTFKYVTHGHKEIAGLIMLMTLAFATTKICMWAIQPYTEAMNLPEFYNGWILSGVMLLGGICGHIGHKIFPSLYGRKALYILLASLVLALIGAGVSTTWFGLACLTYEAFVFGFGMPRAQEAVNNLAGSAERATILSTASVSVSLGFIPMSQVIGWATDEYGIGNGLLAHAALIAALGAWSYILIERNHKRQKAQNEMNSTATGT
ncbi:MAG TPA: MFS transporter [Alphaproteobacteria bacterium]|nr:MFS transporter [Alphaproteobacteria bacterium]HNS43928.1 MFS transporter [Alphaproteobacteria bacterium]